MCPLGRRRLLLKGFGVVLGAPKVPQMLQPAVGAADNVAHQQCAPRERRRRALQAISDTGVRNLGCVGVGRTGGVRVRVTLTYHRDSSRRRASLARRQGGGRGRGRTVHGLLDLTQPVQQLLVVPLPQVQAHPHAR